MENKLQRLEPVQRDENEKMNREQARIRLVDAIHAQCAQTRTRCVIYVSGGAALAFGWLFGRPGASSWLLEAKIPYGRNSMAELFHPRSPPALSCSEDTAVALARVACSRAQKLCEDTVADLHPTRYLGVGFTGALSSYEPKKGGSRCFFAVAREAGFVEASSLRMESLGRDQEEILTSEVVLLTIAKALDVAFDEKLLSLPPRMSTRQVSGSATTQSLVDDPAVTHMLFRPNNLPIIPNPCFSGLVMPGSFNPLHDGHLGLARAAQARFPGLRLVFELAMVNVDKGALSIEEINRRVAQFTEHGIVVSKCPRFYEKANCFENCVFVLGADTAIRLVDNKYYANEMDKIAILTQIIQTRRCKFLVGGRVDSKTNVFQTCENEICAALPASLFQDGFIFLSESEFRMDLSSTELRLGQQKPSTL